MSFIDHEPRKIPKPTPYCERLPLKSAVPDVSMKHKHSPMSNPKIPNNTFSGTEFQSYNTWKWKHMNEKEKENISSESFSHSMKQEFFPINDKFSGTDIERRKNEILYGSVEEPRKPRAPRPVPVIPTCVGASFSDPSFTEELWNDEDVDDKKFRRARPCTKKNIAINYFTDMNKSVQNCIRDDQKDIKDLYQIIADQNKQMVFLQKQIEQLLKSQESKENQIEQLLKSHETKENKIEQLLKMQDLKENQIEQLLKAQEKHEKQIERLIETQDAREKQIIELSKQLKTFDKQVSTTGTMTTSYTICDKSTNTSFQHCCQDEKHQNVEECCKYESEGKSFTLHSLDLPVTQEHALTPQSSIHVDIPEYNASSDEESDASSPTGKDIQIHMVDSKPLGYTFYNNVLTQVNDIIHNNEDKEIEESVKMEIKANKEVELEKEHNRNYLGENYLKMTHSLGRDNIGKYWGIDMYESQTDFQNCVKSSEDNIPRNGRNAAFQITCSNEMGKDTQSPSDISLRMNALALKYLKEEQISQYQMQFQSQQTTKQPDVTIYNVTNLSFGTMRYLERYRISSLENGPSNSSRHQLFQQKIAMRNCNFKNM